MSNINAAVIGRRIIAAPISMAGRILSCTDDYDETPVERVLEKATPFRFSIILGVLLALSYAIYSIATPESAYAIDLKTIADAASGIFAKSLKGPIITIGESTGLLDEPEKFLANMLFNAGQSILFVPSQIIGETANGSILTASFDAIAPQIYSLIKNVHNSIVVPMGNVVAAVLFVIGMTKQFANSSAAESGIDLWKIMMNFIMFGAALIIINASWDILVFMYQLALSMIQRINTMGGVMTVISSGQTPAGMEVADPEIAAGLVFFLLSTIIGLALLISCVIINVSLLVRGVEIYLYTCFSPIAFGFLVTEGGRQMTENFLKKYLALLLAGAIQVLLLIALGLCVKAAGVVIDANAEMGVVEYLTKFLMSFVWVFVIAFMVGKSSTIAKELIGVQ